jgi:phage-related minor tail protein
VLAGGRIADMDSSVPVPRLALRRLGDELAAALRAVTQARAATDPFEVLAQLTVAIEDLTATQHELVNVLLDRGHSWSEVGEALSTSAAAAERRYPRRDRRNEETPD